MQMSSGEQVRNIEATFINTSGYLHPYIEWSFSGLLLLHHLCHFDIIDCFSCFTLVLANVSQCFENHIIVGITNFLHSVSLEQCFSFFHTHLVGHKGQQQVHDNYTSVDGEEYKHQLRGNTSTTNILHFSVRKVVSK